MKKALILATFLTANAATAGGPVIIEETDPVVAPQTEDGRIPGWVVPVGVAVILIALVAGGSTCNGEPEAPPSGGCR